jgi:hypothetical protein
VKNDTFEKYDRPNLIFGELAVEISPIFCYDNSEGITVGLDRFIVRQVFIFATRFITI